MQSKTPLTLETLRPQPRPPQVDLGEAFGIEFQGKLLKLMVGDLVVAKQLFRWFQPRFFQNEAHAWAFGQAKAYFDHYGTMPSLDLLADQARKHPAGAVFAAVLDQTRLTNVTDHQWLQDQAIDFIKRQMFRQAVLDSRDMFNAGAVTQAYDFMQQRMDEMQVVGLDTPDRQWLMEEFPERHIRRQNTDWGSVAIGTGIPELDRTLGGGPQPGFCGVWLARPKMGKSTLLVNLGAVAIRSYRKRTLHIALEGSGNYIADRYDTVFTDEVYRMVRRGEIDSERYARAYSEMQYNRGLCVIRAFTDRWNYTAEDIFGELQDLKRGYDWDPELVVIDYCDLLEGRGGRQRYKSDMESQKASFQDCKNIANRGCVVWTASQVQRPANKDFDHVQENLKSREIADCYAKVRIADMVGSVNQNQTEREQKLLRLYVELLRDEAANKTITVSADFERMRVGAETYSMINGDLASTASRPKSKSIGYRQPTQGRAGWVQATGV